MVDSPWTAMDHGLWSMVYRLKNLDLTKVIS